MASFPLFQDIYHFQPCVLDLYLKGRTRTPARDQVLSETIRATFILFTGFREGHLLLSFVLVALPPLKSSVGSAAQDMGSV